jgi:hypothetical protein
MIVIADQEGFKLAIGIYSLQQDLYQVMFIQTVPEFDNKHTEFYLTLEQLQRLQLALNEVL